MEIEILIKIPARFLCENWQADSNIDKEVQGTRIAKTILKKKKIRGFTLLF